MNETVGEREILSLEECRQSLTRFHLSDEQIEALRDSLIGVVNNILNQYVDGAR